MAGRGSVSQDTCPDSTEIRLRFGKKCCSTAVKSVFNHLYWPFILRISTPVRFLAGHGVMDVQTKCASVRECVSVGMS